MITKDIINREFTEEEKEGITVQIPTKHKRALELLKNKLEISGAKLIRFAIKIFIENFDWESEGLLEAWNELKT